MLRLMVLALCFLPLAALAQSSLVISDDVALMQDVVRCQRYAIVVPPHEPCDSETLVCKSYLVRSCDAAAAKWLSSGALERYIARTSR